MIYQIKALGLVSTNLATKHFFLKYLGPKRPKGGGGARNDEMISSKYYFFTHVARFAQGMQNVILHIYFIIKIIFMEFLIPTIYFLLILDDV